jgi:hypothetical protein
MIRLMSSGEGTKQSVLSAPRERAAAASSAAFASAPRRPGFAWSGERSSFRQNLLFAHFRDPLGGDHATNNNRHTSQTEGDLQESLFNGAGVGATTFAAQL